MKKSLIIALIMCFLMVYVVNASLWNITSPYVRYDFENNVTDTGTGFSYNAIVNGTGTQYNSLKNKINSYSMGIDTLSSVNYYNSNIGGSTGTWAIGGWFYFNSTSGNRWFFCNGIAPAGDTNSVCLISIGVNVNYDRPAVADVDTGQDIVAGVWEHWILAKTGTHYTIYRNGTAVFNSTAESSLGGNNDIAIGNNWWDKNAGLNGFVDNIIIINRTITQQDIADMMDNITTSPVVIETKSITILLRNYTNNEILNTYMTNTLFFVNANYSSSITGQITNASCSFTSKNISYYSEKTGNNFTLSSSVNFTHTLTEGVLNLINDDYKFYICRNGNKKDIKLFVNDVLHKTINQNDIPLCSLGSHYEFNVTTSFNANANLNITIACNSCLSDTFVIISHNNTLFNYNRNFLSHSENMTYNSTIKLYEKLHLYRFIDSGIGKGNINITCDATNQYNTYDVGNTTLNLSVLSIDDIAFYNGIVVNNNFSLILADVSGNYKNISLSLYNSTNLIKSVYSESISISNATLYYGNLNISLIVYDYNNIRYDLNYYFYLNDTESPICSGLNDSTSLINTNYMFNIVCSDNMNFFLFNLSCSNGHTYYSDNINSLLYTYAGNMNLTGNTICSIEYCDGHTLNSLDSYEIEQKTLSSVDFKFNSRDLNQLYTSENSKIATSVLTDRINFNISFTNISKTGTYKVYYKTSANSYYIPSDKYKAWIVDIPSRTWFDMNELGKDINDIKVFYNGSGLYEITIYSNKNTFAFQSIGKINCIKDSFNIAAYIDTSVNILNFEFTTRNTWLYMIFIIFYIALLFMTFSFKNFMLGSFAFIIGILLAFMSLGISVILTIAFFFINIVLFMAFGKFSQ